MKEIDNRQNKLIQMKASLRPYRRAESLDKNFSEVREGARQGGAVFGLVSNLLVASKIAQSAKYCHLSIHNFDQAEPLLAHSKQKLPVLIVLDWDEREAEAFKLLEKIKHDEGMKKLPTVGYVSQAKIALKEDAQRAGCHRVYSKSDFLKNLNDILTRYAQ